MCKTLAGASVSSSLLGSLSFSWVKAQNGLEGNIEADSAAKVHLSLPFVLITLLTLSSREDRSDLNDNVEKL